VAVRVALDAVSGRMATDLAEPAAAARRLAEIAGGRADLLGDATGAVLGRVLGTGAVRPEALLAAGYLLLAGADLDRARASARDVAHAMSAPTHRT